MPELYRRLIAEMERSPDVLVPPAYQVLWETKRFIVLYGGRAAAKSWSIARVLLVMGHEVPLRMLCCREIQGSIKESAYRLLADQIVMLQLDDFYEVQADAITGKNGSRFYFEGLRFNASKIRSYEGVDIVWIEEAQNVSELSFETLLPTIRKARSRFFISFNPMTRDDPVFKRFVEAARPDCIPKKVSYRDNPHLSPEAEAERGWLEKTDPDAYRHVWEGEPRQVSDALILRGKYVAEAFEVRPHWAGPYHGLDFGFSRDPSAAIRAYIDDGTRTLYIDKEFWGLGVDIDALPTQLEMAIPGVSRHVLHCDSARPESISYLARHGIPNARSTEKWSGSVDDGVSFLRSFSRIVIDPSCRHLLDECSRYSFEQDRLTGAPLAKVLDAHNHCIDAVRYALVQLIRNSGLMGSYFQRAALLANEEPTLPGQYRPEAVFGVITMSDRPSASVGLTILAWGRIEPYVTVLDWDLAELEEALSVEWLSARFKRMGELQREWRAMNGSIVMHVEQGSFCDSLVAAAFQYVIDQNGLIDIHHIEKKLTAEQYPTIESRTSAIRALVNSGKVKIAGDAFLKQSAHRSATSNHFLAQVLGYQPGKDAPHDLVHSLALGALLVMKHAGVV